MLTNKEFKELEDRYFAECWRRNKSQQPTSQYFFTTSVTHPSVPYPKRYRSTPNEIADKIDKNTR